MKIVVIGGSGLVGNYVVKTAAAAGHAVIGTYRNYRLPGLVQLESADRNAIHKLLDEQQPQAVVYAAGWTWVDGCEDNPARAFAENVEQPLVAAQWCRQAQCQFAYFSTSYVFDGKMGPYAESATPNPVNVYGRAKLKAEEVLAHATDGNALVARLIYVYGAEAQQKNFACQVWRAVESGKKLILPSDQEGNPTYAGDIARWLMQLLEHKATGIWHLAGPDPRCDKAKWGQHMVSAFRDAGVQQHPDFSITAISTAEMKQRALRPLKAGLLTPRSDTLNLPPTELEQAIANMVRSGGTV